MASSFDVQFNVRQLFEYFGLPFEAQIAEEYSRNLEESIVSPRSYDVQTAASGFLDAIIRSVLPADQSRFHEIQEKVNSRNPKQTVAFLAFLTEMAEDKELWISATPTPHSAIQNFFVNGPPSSAGSENAAENALLEELADLVVDGTIVPRDLQQKALLAHKREKRQKERIRILKEREVPVEEPSFIRDRPFLSTAIKLSDFSIPWPSVKDVSFKEQEELMVSELIYALKGIMGRNIRARKDLEGQLELVVNPDLCVSVRQRTQELLSLAKNYNTVVLFVESRRPSLFGSVNQALGAALSEFVHKYVDELTKLALEDNLTFALANYRLLDIFLIFKALSDICNEIEQGDLIGGQVLTVLHSKEAGFLGSEPMRQICTWLLQAAVKPYFVMLQEWLFLGIIDDIFDEFMIVDNGANISEFDDAERWEQRYFLRHRMCPSFLSDISTDLLNCGKFLNITSSCREGSGKLPRTPMKLPDYSPTPHPNTGYRAVIDAALAHASKDFLNLLLEQYDLINRFGCLKRYFCVEQGDWLLQFMETAESELEKPVGNVLPHRLSSLLALALRTSSGATDPYNDCIGCHLSENSLPNFLCHLIGIKGDEGASVEKVNLMCPPDPELVGMDGFHLTYDVDWPLSVVFSRKTRLQYQIIFRQIWRCKYVERMLCRWRGPMEGAVLRQRMLSFVQSYMFYCTTEIVETYWRQFLQRIKEAKNIKEVIWSHGDFLSSCTKDCLLTENQLVVTMDSALRLCLEFAKNRILGHKQCEWKFLGLLESLLTELRSLGETQDNRAWQSFSFRLSMAMEGVRSTD